MPDAWTDPSLAFTPSPTPVGFIRTVYEDSWSVATFEVEITAADIVAATAHCAADGADGCERAGRAGVRALRERERRGRARRRAAAARRPTNCRCRCRGRSSG